jgi:GNAT superfamily N-acetyltransferase
VEIRRLRPSDDRSRFRSGDPDLDRFLRTYAGQNQFRHHLGVTYVAVEEGDVLGYLTVAPGGIEIDDLPASVRKGLPRYPLPVLRLARLAVDSRARGHRLGEQLLRFALGLAATMAQDYGCLGVAVDAKPGSEAFYSRYGFQTMDLVEGLSESRPRPTPMFLPTSAIVAATTPAQGRKPSS